MKRLKGKTVKDILAAQNARNRGIAKELRSLLRETLPTAVETVKWGNITYTLNGKNLAWLLFFDDHMDLGFFLGAKLKSKRLEGTGKGLRHIKVRTKDDIDRTEFRKLLSAAAGLAS
jgi:hypothetical protein